jgi:hypothetical protein
MNFAPTNIVHAFEGEVVEGGGRNKFRPYKHSAIPSGWKVLRVRLLRWQTKSEEMFSFSSVTFKDVAFATEIGVGI